MREQDFKDSERDRHGPRVRVVIGWITRDNRVLVGLRPPGRPLAGCWELPGGKVEPGEADVQALRRELEEELGVRPVVGKRLAAVASGEIDLVVYACDVGTDEPRPLVHVELAWVEPARITDRQLPGPTRKALPQLLRASQDGDASRFSSASGLRT